ncbi:conserved hypothetical protein [Azospirillaceae bacterium]
MTSPLELDDKDKLILLSSIYGNRDNSSDNMTEHVVSKVIDVDPELIGGNYWKTLTADITRYGNQSFSLNGFGYNCGGGDAGPIYFSSITQYNDTTNAWSTKSSMSIARLGTRGFILNNFGYICGGGTGFLFSEVHKYNDSSDVLTAVTLLNGIGRNYSNPFGLNGFGYICGGSSGTVRSYVSKYNDSSDSWTLKANFGVYISATFELGSFGYACTGNSVASSNVYKYNDVSDTWSTNAVATAKTNTAGFLSAGFGYISHGTSSVPATTSSLQQYNESAIYCVDKAPGGTAKSLLHGFSLNGLGYVTCGSGVSATSEVNKYYATNMHDMGRFKSSAKTPSKVLVATNVSGYAKSLPVWIRTDGVNWKYMESNVDSLVKQGQTVISTLAASGGYYQYELMVGLPPTNVGTGASGGGGAAGGGYWVTKFNTGTARYGAGCFSLNGYGYVCCGGNSVGDSSEVNQFNDQLNTWTTKASTVVIKKTAGVSLNGFGYTVDGFTGLNTQISNCDKYNDSTNAWSAITSNGARRILQCFSLNGFFYTCNGIAASNVSTCEQYNDTINSWLAKAGAGTARNNISAFSIGGFGYVSCGTTGTVSSETGQYNDAANVWTTKTGNPSARVGAAGLNINNSGYTCDGSTGSLISTVSQYDSASNLWNTKNPGGTARWHIAGFTLNSFGYICNGSDSLALGTMVSNVDQYVPNTPIPVLTVTLDVVEA